MILPATGNLVKKAAYAQMRTMVDEVKTERTAKNWIGSRCAA